VQHFLAENKKEKEEEEIVMRPPKGIHVKPLIVSFSLACQVADIKIRRQAACALRDLAANPEFKVKAKQSAEQQRRGVSEVRGKCARVEGGSHNRSVVLVLLRLF
jgi:hypothetical protein